MPYKDPEKKRQYDQRYSESHREEKRAYGAKWYKENRVRHRDNGRKWRAANNERTKRYDRNRNLFNKYGLSLEAYDRMLEQQRGVCACCGGPPDSKYNVLYVDHDHKTGEVRSLLCGGCNTAIGALRDSSVVAGSAVLYLKRFGK